MENMRPSDPTSAPHSLPPGSPEEVAPASPTRPPEVTEQPVPGKFRVIWESFKLGLSQKEVRDLYKSGEMGKLKDFTFGLGFSQTKKMAKVQVAIRDILLQAVPKGEAAPGRAEVWKVAAELTQAVVMKEIENKETGIIDVMERGQTYKAKTFKVPYSIEYRNDGSMLIKLKPGKGLGVKFLGQGSFGKVTRGIQIDAGAVRKRAVQPIAHKREEVRGFDRHNEFNMNVAAAGCKGIVKMHTVLDYEGPVTLEGVRREKVQKIGTVFEFCNRGDLDGFLRSGEFAKLPEKEQLRLFREVLVGVRELHKAGIVHLDLKPQNLMLTERNGRLHVRIGDLGLAAHIGTPALPCGTLGYVAPELLDGMTPTFEPPMDYYSLGVIATILFGLRYDEESHDFVQKPMDNIPIPTQLLFTMKNSEPGGRLDIDGAILYVDMRLKEIRRGS